MTFAELPDAIRDSVPIEHGTTTIPSTACVPEQTPAGDVVQRERLHHRGARACGIEEGSASIREAGLVAARPRAQGRRAAMVKTLALDDIAAGVCSGTHAVDGMVVVPCSMGRCRGSRPATRRTSSSARPT